MNDIVTIELFGQKYSFKADRGVADADEVADLLVQEVASVEKKLSNDSSKLNKITILTLAALNITNEYINLKNKHANLQEKISERSALLVNKIDVNLQRNAKYDESSSNI